MKKWARISLATGLGIVFILFAHFLTHREPSYEGKSLSSWFKQLEKPGSDSATARKAMREMGASAVPYLVFMLKKEDSRWDKFYQANWFRLPAVVQARLPIPEPAIAKQARAATALGVIGPPAGEAVPELISIFKNARPNVLPLSQVTTGVARTRKANTKPIFPVRPVGGPGFVMNTDLRYLVVSALGSIGGERGDIIPTLLAALHDGDEIVRLSAEYALRNTNLLTAARMSIPELLEAFAGSDARARAVLATTLGLIVSEKKEVIPHLIKGLKDASDQVRGNSARALGTARSDFQTIAPALTESVMDDSSFVQSMSTTALKELSSRSDLVVTVLMNALSHEHARIRARAAATLGTIGPKAKPALPALTERTKDSDKLVRFHSAEALWKIDHQAYAIIPFRIEALKDKDDRIRWYAASFLGEVGPEAKSAVPALIEMLANDESNRLRARAAMTLARIGSEALAAIPALTQALRDQYSNVREAAGQALDKLGPTSGK